MILKDNDTHHHVIADPTRAQQVAGTASPFRIDLVFRGGLTTSQMAAFDQAAFRWTRVIVGDLPSMIGDNGEVIDDLLIFAGGANLGGPGGVLAEAGPTRFRGLFGLPYAGIMRFDIADLRNMENEGTLVDVITHEMGHVLGIGTLWPSRGLITDAGTEFVSYVGPNGMSARSALTGDGQNRPVEVENMFGPGSADAHWRESVYSNELMSSLISARGNPLSLLTVASLADLGYQVDFNAAEFYLPGSPPQAALDGPFVTCHAPVDGRGMIQPVVPIRQQPIGTGRLALPLPPSPFMAITG
ncbi:leishmanolysin-related zinc metalloendopeptidase [Streptomyces flaveus]|uniref:leishmanolysin-related zinc metalloendopeptidase n=1 Tax=Streptomyces flaveus TaxID=66370 RepID=UPI00332A216E